MTVDTIFLCYCEDIEENDGSTMKPYFMSPELREIVESMKNFAKSKGKHQVLQNESDTELQNRI
jgi:solute carrier family 44 (choline transporter-like protein), member 2/4/5